MTRLFIVAITVMTVVIVALAGHAGGGHSSPGTPPPRAFVVTPHADRSPPP